MQKMDKLEINSLTLTELESWLVDLDIPKFRAAQIFRWIHKHGVTDFAKMNNLPSSVWEILKQHFVLEGLTILSERVSTDGTIKYLFALADGQTIESVLLPESNRNTICVSSQVGCAMGCTFCATGKQGFARNLSAGEINAQIEIITTMHPDLTNVVFMGMGEPFANYEQVMKSIAILNDEQGKNLGARKITISTCGIVPMIKNLADDHDQVGLAVSLHAANDDKRKTVMPLAAKYSLKDLILACRYYTERTHRRVTFEYAMIVDFNDSKQDLEELVSLLSGLNCHVNVIPINPVVEDYVRPHQQRVKDFTSALNQRHIAASVRKERGGDIEAACGQLRQAVKEE